MFYGDPEKHKRKKLSSKVRDIFKSIASHSKKRQALGLFVTVFVKRVVKQLRNVTCFTPTKNYHCKRLQTEKPLKEECVKYGRMVNKTTVNSHEKNRCPKQLFHERALDMRL